MVAVLWIAANFHCQLESIPAFGFLSCCQHSEVEKTATHHENECAQDGCATVESGLYHQEARQDAPIKPPLDLVGFSLIWPPVERDASAAATVPSASFPPEFLKVWQFSLRAALPVRAPSIAS